LEPELNGGLAKHMLAEGKGNKVATERWTSAANYGAWNSGKGKHTPGTV